MATAMGSLLPYTCLTQEKRVFELVWASVLLEWALKLGCKGGFKKRGLLPKCILKQLCSINAKLADNLRENTN